MPLDRAIAVLRGERSVPKIDFATAPWRRNSLGVNVLDLSVDPVSGAKTYALDTPPGLVVQENEHFYDCEEELFQFEGEFHHDHLLPYHQGDYIYRPVGTVYGHGEGSEGGIIVVMFARKPVRFHFAGYQEEWTGHHLVDRKWATREAQPYLKGERDVEWEPSPLGEGVSVKKLKGEPGQSSTGYGASTHSPWASEAAFLLRLPAGFDGPMPEWANTILEGLVLSGGAVIDGEPWQRGCYSFGHVRGHCRVSEELVLFVRAFAT